MSDIDRYLEYIGSLKRYSSRTCQIYREILEAYGDDFSISALRSYEVRMMDKEKLSARTVNQHMSVLSGFCKFLMKEGRLKSNPVRLVPRPKQEKRLPVFYRDESMRSYFESHKGTLEYGNPDAALRYMIVSLLAGTGMRRAELIGLDLKDFDPSRRVLHVTGKGNKMREIPLTSVLCDEISLYLQKVGSTEELDGPLLRTPSGLRLYPVFVDRAVKEELQAVDGITGRRSPHVLRHTLATELLNDGSDINCIKELLGHSSLAATQVYTHNSIERLKSVYNNAHPRAKKGGNNGD